jgi:hypothetical protein
VSAKLFYVENEPVVINDDNSVSYLGEFTIDADGSPRCYGPVGIKPTPLDNLANAGRPGNWWGIATHNDTPSGQPITQSDKDPYPGFFVSTTAYKVPGYFNGDTRRELNSEVIPFMVVPIRLVSSVRGIVVGCKGRITDNRTGIFVDVVVGDLGPNNHLGEGSIAAAAALKLPTSAKRGGSSVKMFTWTCWPGIAAPGFVLQSRKTASAKRVAMMDAVVNADYAIRKR